MEPLEQFVGVSCRDTDFQLVRQESVVSKDEGQCSLPADDCSVPSEVLQENVGL